MGDKDIPRRADAAISIRGVLNMPSNGVPVRLPPPPEPPNPERACARSWGLGWIARWFAVKGPCFSCSTNSRCIRRGDWPCTRRRAPPSGVSMVWVDSRPFAFRTELRPFPLFPGPGPLGAGMDSAISIPSSLWSSQYSARCVPTGPHCGFFLQATCLQVVPRYTISMVMCWSHRIGTSPGRPQKARSLHPSNSHLRFCTSTMPSRACSLQNLTLLPGIA
mmetsp:Transcript_34411/g.50317  ORF Transcript_34411/g.50317 Transcript_34411/m.50317 type:complete len:220 (-) Transcript_34411:137-796(-)